MISKLFSSLQKFGYVGDIAGFTTEPKPVVHSSIKGDNLKLTGSEPARLSLTGEAIG
ncbi:MAG: hypothetical protein HKO79_08955 [Desulfobacterales bacterium]|nr:hypothetical protein [Deltaproteobacteria bacterium]NNL42610.1 hypothetical protein [Desulfobacterales bacterium]